MEHEDSIQQERSRQLGGGTTPPRIADFQPNAYQPNAWLAGAARTSTPKRPDFRFMGGPVPPSSGVVFDSPSSTSLPVLTPPQPPPPGVWVPRESPGLRPMLESRLQVPADSQAQHIQPQTQQSGSTKKTGAPGSYTSFSSRLKSSMMSALGMSRPKVNGGLPPPGLLNNSQNSCFVNAVLVCLAHTPTLLECLQSDLRLPANPGHIHNLIQTLHDITQKLRSKPQMQPSPPVDATAFLHAASMFPTSNVMLPGKAEQTQQDCAEFLVWLLGTIHDGLHAIQPTRGLPPKSTPILGGYPGPVLRWPQQATHHLQDGIPRFPDPGITGETGAVCI